MTTVVKQIEIPNPEPTKNDRVRTSIDTSRKFKIALFNKAREDGTDVNKLTRQFWEMYLLGQFEVAKQ